MFDLNNAIMEWREQMLAAGIKTPAPMEELESHLRDDVEERMNSGLSAEEAFELAAQQIGTGAVLRLEFDKVPLTLESKPVQSRRISSFILAGLYGLFCFSVVLGHEMSRGQLVLATLAVVLGVIGLGSWSYLDRYLPVVAERRTRELVQAGFSLLGPIAFAGGGLILSTLSPDADESVGQNIVKMLWLALPGIVCGGISIGIGTAARQKTVLSGV
jgi:hypothetical protein